MRLPAPNWVTSQRDNCFPNVQLNDAVLHRFTPSTAMYTLRTRNVYNIYTRHTCTFSRQQSSPSGRTAEVRLNKQKSNKLLIAHWDFSTEMKH